MYRLAWIMILNGRQSGPLHFSREGKKYSEIALAIAAAEHLNERIATLEYCVVGDFTREVLWCQAKSRIKEEAIAIECPQAPQTRAGSNA